MSGFDEPDEVGGVRIDPKEVLHHLLLVWAVDYIEHSPTKYSRPDKLSDVIVVDAVDLDQVDPETNQYGLTGRRCWWRQARLIGALRSKIGRPNPMLCRIQKGVPTMGQAPYELVSMTSDPQCATRANEWFQRNPHFTPSKQAPPAQARPEGPPANLDEARVNQGQQPDWSKPPPPPPPQLPPPSPPAPNPSLSEAQHAVLQRMARLGQTGEPADPKVTGF